jgi:hypothetical protein
MIAVKHKTFLKVRTVLAVVFITIVSSLFAAKGGGEGKDKKGYVLKVNGFEVKATYLSPFSLMKQGATLKGNVSPMQTTSSQNPNNRAIVTYERGNTIYIQPVQQKGFIYKFKTPTNPNP